MAINIGQAVQPYRSTQSNIEARLLPAEALELATATIAFSRVPQWVWPYARSDNIPGQQFHLTQIPFHVQINADTGMALTYHIMIYFKKPFKDYVSIEIVQLIAERLALMQLPTGDILDPIAPLCSTKSNKPWNGMIKLHLMSPTKDDHQLLTSKKVFALVLDGELKIGKIVKGYAATTYNDQLTVKIEGVALKDEPAYSVILQIVESSSRCSRAAMSWRLPKSTKSLPKPRHTSSRQHLNKRKSYYSIRYHALER